MYIKVYVKCFTVFNLIAAKVFIVHVLKSERCLQCICLMSGGAKILTVYVLEAAMILQPLFQEEQRF